MSSSPIPWKHVRNVLVLFAPLWCGVTLLFGIMGVGYALLKVDLYSASQPLVVRDEASSSVTRLGRFPSQTELKAAQKTIQEMAHNREVVTAALREIGPPTGRPDPEYPNTEVVDSIAGSRVSLLAPNGAEFGNTEVVYLQVKAKTPERASKFCDAMLKNLTSQLRKVRQVRADSMIAELSHTREVARRNLDEASQRMHEMEIEFGADLGELRNLNDAISGDGANRRALESITDDLNRAQLALEKRQSLYELLVAGAEDPQELLINGGDLLADQPSLLRLKEGLIDAQIASSQQSGVYTTANPKQRVSLAAEREIQARMQAETTAVIRAMEPMLKLERAQVEQLQRRKGELSQRLGRLANARTDYAKLDAEVSQRTEQLAETERALAEATAIRSAALSTNLVEDLGPPQVTEHPVGPSGSLLAMGATMAGLICGLGAVFLIAPGPTEARGGRRWSDHLQERMQIGNPVPPVQTAAAQPPQCSPAPKNPAPDTAARQPVASQPVAKQSVATQTVATQPIAKQPVAKANAGRPAQPPVRATKQPTIQQPAGQASRKPAAQQPTQPPMQKPVRSQQRDAAPRQRQQQTSGQAQQPPPTRQQPKSGAKSLVQPKPSTRPQTDAIAPTPPRTIQPRPGQSKGKAAEPSPQAKKPLRDGPADSSRQQPPASE